MIRFIVMATVMVGLPLGNYACNCDCKTCKEYPCNDYIPCPHAPQPDDPPDIPPWFPPGPVGPGIK